MGLFVVVTVAVVVLSRVVVEGVLAIVLVVVASALLITTIFFEKGVNAPVEETREVRINRVCFMIAMVVLWESVFYETIDGEGYPVPFRMWVLLLIG
jgi:hypothetical protein